MELSRGRRQVFFRPEGAVKYSATVSVVLVIGNQNTDGENSPAEAYKVLCINS
jgi:hypothetical protein